MSTKFTSEQWAAKSDAVPEYVTQVTVYAESTGDRIATVFEREAVPLVAAAPDLYAALREMVDAWEGPRERAALRFAAAVIKARSALAKASGV